MPGDPTQDELEQMTNPTGDGEHGVPSEADIERAKEAWTRARGVADDRYDEYRRLQNLRSDALGAPFGWEPVSAPAGYRNVPGGPPNGRIGEPCVEYVGRTTTIAGRTFADPCDGCGWMPEDHQ